MQAAAASDPELSRIEAVLNRGKQTAEGRIRLAIFCASVQQVKDSGSAPSLASVTAAIITGLEGPSLNDAATVSAMFFLLSTLLPTLSDAVLRVHADSVSRRVTQAIAKHPDVVPVLRFACPVLSRLLICQVTRPPLPALIPFNRFLVHALPSLTPHPARIRLAWRRNGTGCELPAHARATCSAKGPPSCRCVDICAAA